MHVGFAFIRHKIPPVCLTNHFCSGFMKWLLILNFDSDVDWTTLHGLIKEIFYFIIVCIPSFYFQLKFIEFNGFL